MSPRPPHRPTPARGFTLVELLTVIAIIGILAGLLIPAIGMVQNKVRVVRSKTLFASLANSFDAYNNEYKTYPIFTELNADRHPWTTNKGEEDDNFLLNDGAGLLFKVLTNDQGPTGGSSVNHNPKGISFLNLDDNQISREAPLGTATDPVIIDGFRNAEIGVVIHIGQEKTIQPEAFSRPVNDSLGAGPLKPVVMRPIDDRMAFYSLINVINNDPINSDWVSTWDYAEYSH